MAEQESGKRTLWHWLSWVGGLFFLFLAVAALMDSRVIATLAALGIVALLLPPVRAWAYAKSGAHLPGLGRAVLIFLLSFVFMVFVPPPDETARQPQQQAAEEAAPQVEREAPAVADQAVSAPASTPIKPAPALSDTWSPEETYAYWVIRWNMDVGEELLAVGAQFTRWAEDPASVTGRDIERLLSNFKRLAAEKPDGTPPTDDIAGEIEAAQRDFRTAIDQLMLWANDLYGQHDYVEVARLLIDLGSQGVVAATNEAHEWLNSRRKDSLSATEPAPQANEPEPSQEQPALSASAEEYRQTTLSLFHVNDKRHRKLWQLSWTNSSPFSASASTARHYASWRRRSSLSEKDSMA